jgi:Zn-dependent peptidase ImmA (M78 family)
MFCRVEECNLEIMMTFRINGFDTSDFPLGATVFGIHFPDVDLLESIGEMQYEILRKMVESRLGIEANEEIMHTFTALHEIGHYLDHFNGFGMEEAIAEMSIREEIVATALEEGEDKANIMYREIPSERRADEFALSILESIIS